VTAPADAGNNAGASEMTNQTNIDDELRKTIENDLARFVQEHLDAWCPVMCCQPQITLGLNA
jgi:hypothetical protein